MSSEICVISLKRLWREVTFHLHLFTKEISIVKELIIYDETHLRVR
jgi:hypothetical protein